jgi:hypothetical protein
MDVKQYLQQLPPYQKVFKPITEDPQLTSPQISWASKYFSLRLLTGIECNAIGFFVLGVQSICVAHEITPEDVIDIMTELAEKTDYLYFDPKSHTVLIRNYLKWNPPPSPRAVKSMLKDLTRIRKRRGALYPQMLLTLEDHMRRMGEVFDPAIHKLVAEMVEEYVQEKTGSEECSPAQM